MSVARTRTTPETTPDERQTFITKSVMFFKPRPLFGGPSLDSILTERGRRLKRRFSIAVVLAALAVIPLLVLESQVTHPSGVLALQIADWVIWGVFAIELSVMLAVTPNRRAYLRSAWLDVAIVTLTLPILPYLIAGLRISRLGRLVDVLRLMRLLRLTALINRAGAMVQRIFATAGLGYMFISLVGLIIVCGTLFSSVESGFRVRDGIWWALVTATSVGYGDIVPATGLGRMLGTLLMLGGVSLIALLSAATAARLVDLEAEQNQEEVRHTMLTQRRLEEEMRDELREVNERLAQMEELLRANGHPTPVD